MKCMDINDVNNFPKKIPEQKQNTQPGIEAQMNPLPISDYKECDNNKLLEGKVAVITGGDSGIGKAVGIAFAKEGADIAIIYLNENEDAQNTKKIIEGLGKRCVLIPGDIGDENFCNEAVKKVIQEYNHIDILVNNAAEQHPQNSILDITKEQLEKTFSTNVFGMFYITKAVLPHLRKGSSIINTASITAYKGDEGLIDYSASKGAVVSLTRSLSQSLIKLGIRVNEVAPGPVWTPLIPSSFSEQEVGRFGSDTPMGRPGQPVELAEAYVFLASYKASYITGQTIHVNGGIVINN